MNTVPQNGRTSRASIGGFPRSSRSGRRGPADIRGVPAPILDAETEVQLIESWQTHNDPKALQQLVASYQVLVAKIASRYRSSGIPFEDLMSEGNVGLVHAIEKFDAGRGFRLSTYAMWWIRAGIADYALASSSIVRGVVTERQKRVFFALRRVKASLSATSHDELSDDSLEMLAESLGVAASDVNEVNEWMVNKDVSINAAPEFEDTAGDEWQEFLISPDDDPESRVVQADEKTKRRRLLHDAVETLDERERYIVKQRHLANTPEKLADIGTRFGITRERVRQIETRALQKLRRRVCEVAESHGMIGEGVAAVPSK